MDDDWDDFFVLPDEDESFFSKIDEDLDYAFALSLQDQLNEDSNNETLEIKSSSNCDSKTTREPLGIIDKQWELLDPNPDIHALFLQYNTRFFYGKLDTVEVRWSPRMTLCAGVCSYEGRGGLCSVRLSLPLLKLRPRRDLVETLLHEMIHAFLFVTDNNKDHNAHGPEFLKHMHRINKETGTKITVYHSFHDEVDLYRSHWWKCNGPCQKRRPFFGLVKRAMNRAPSSKDFWWSDHQSSCGGTFIKIKEPENNKKKPLKRKNLEDNNNSSNINKYLKSSASKETASSSKQLNKIYDTNRVKSILAKEDNLVSVRNGDSKSSLNDIKTVVPFSGLGHHLGSSSSVAPKSFLASIRHQFPSSSIKNSKLVQKNLKPDFFNPIVPKCEAVENRDPTSSDPQFVSRVPKKGSTLVQNSIDKYVISPSRPTSSEREKSIDSNIKVECPICFKKIENSEINKHLDVCLQK